MYEKYDARLKLQSHGKRVKSSAQNATQRLETGVYNFSPPRTELSRELEAVYVKKIQVQDVDAWDGEIDRMEWSNRSGILAAPLGADLFLMTERGPNTIMSSSRFFLDELLTHDGPPDARSRFPVAEIATMSAKKICRMITRYYQLKVYCVTCIQRNYRFYRFRMRSRKEYQERHLMANRLQFWFKKIKHRASIVRHKKEILLKYTIRIQAAFRYALARRRVVELKQDYKMRRIVLLRYWLNRQVRRWRKSRGKMKREEKQVRKIQALVRGRKTRKVNLYRVLIYNRILKWWKMIWLRKYGDRARQLLRKLRNSLWNRKIRLLQNTVRRFLAKLRVARVRISHLAYERTRLHGEVLAMHSALELSRSAESKIRKDILLHKTGWDWDVWQNLYQNQNDNDSSQGSQDSKSKGPKSSPNSKLAQSDDGSVSSPKSPNSVKQLTKKQYDISTVISKKVEVISKILDCPIDYAEEFLMLDDHTHRILEGHWVYYLPENYHDCLKPFFLGPKSIMKDRVTSAILLAFSNLPDGKLDAGSLELLVNKTSYLRPRRESILTRAKKDAEHTYRIHNYRYHTQLHQNMRIELMRSIKHDKLDIGVPSKHYRHKHFLDLSDDANCGMKISNNKQICRRKRSVQRRNPIISTMSQYDHMGHHYANLTNSASKATEVQRRRGETDRHQFFASIVPSIIHKEMKKQFTGDRLHHMHLAPIPSPAERKRERSMEQIKYSSLGQNLETSAWQAAARMRWHDGSSLIQVAEPSLAIRMKIEMSSVAYLPDKLLHQALLVRRWVRHIVEVLHNARERYRQENSAYPRRECIKCGYGFAADHDLRLHEVKGCMGHSAILESVTWETMAPYIALLVERCTKLSNSIPKIHRQYTNVGFTYIEDEKICQTKWKEICVKVDTMKSDSVGKTENCDVDSQSYDRLREDLGGAVNEEEEGIRE
jgi:hypothetical protein